MTDRLMLVIRNLKDFAGTGISLLNTFEEVEV